MYKRQEGKTLGRLASEVATVLRGKNKPTFTPHVDCGDYVIVINAEKIEVTGKKRKEKIYKLSLIHIYMNVAVEEIDLKNPKTNRGNAGFSDQERDKMRQLQAAGFVDTFRYLYPDTDVYKRQLLDQAETGDNVGALLRGVQRDEIERGQVLAKPGTIHPHTKFKGEVYVLKKEEGGRHTPFFNGYRPQFYFRTCLLYTSRCV